MEVWKQYRDTIYEVSNMGRVRNRETKYIKSQTDKNNGKKEHDYKYVGININGKKKKIAVHRMVGECFIENPNNLPEINHKNTIRNDNRVENLEWCTREYNYQHSIEQGVGSPRKAVRGINKETKEVLEFKSLWEAGKYLKGIASDKINIDQLCYVINKNIKGVSKSAYGYEWELM